MSDIALAAPYLDTDADQLSFALDLPAREALAVSEVTAGALTVQLRLLGASHQVFAGPVRETVACLPDAAGGLPATVTHSFDAWHYHFTARVLDFSARSRSARPHSPRDSSAAGFTPYVARLRDRLSGRPEALCGVFPGSPDAVTALTVEEEGSGVGWRTWHTYPQSRRIVATHTWLEAR
ncbi:DUF2617 family protein [Streptomyces sp. WMMC1477]|uniref:DUF2617 family protein n=1 Tax=Streptomyces sp. WMMC1477 TaxID=3015155 RepID=UPI0022B75484|nr:DUF2617 family protein [Streptomyces sp. WMMC1477]MCZ7434716.1 DUF2617 family protein [Streptomyces sp. WMMC1477]